MTCPQCHLLLEPADWQHLSIAVCGSCGGCWFAGPKASETIRSRLATLPELDQAYPSHAVGGMFEGLPRYCPDCTTVLMARETRGDPADGTPFACGRCGGIWLEAGEPGLRDSGAAASEPQSGELHKAGQAAEQFAEAPEPDDPGEPNEPGERESGEPSTPAAAWIGLPVAAPATSTHAREATREWADSVPISRPPIPSESVIRHPSSVSEFDLAPESPSPESPDPVARIIHDAREIGPVLLTQPAGSAPPVVARMAAPPERWCPQCRRGFPRTESTCPDCMIGLAEGAYKIRCLHCGAENPIFNGGCWSCQQPIHPVGRSHQAPPEHPPHVDVARVGAAPRASAGSCGGGLIVLAALAALLGLCLRG